MKKLKVLLFLFLTAVVSGQLNAIITMTLEDSCTLCYTVKYLTPFDSYGFIQVEPNPEGNRTVTFPANVQEGTDLVAFGTRVCNDGTCSYRCQVNCQKAQDGGILSCKQESLPQ